MNAWRWVLGGVLARVIGARAAGGGTNILLLTFAACNINPFTLSMNCEDVQLREVSTVDREVLNVARCRISLSIWRLLFLQTLYFDDLRFDGVHLRLLQDNAGRLTPFHDPGMSNATLIVQRMNATNVYTRADANREHARAVAQRQGVQIDRDPTTLIIPMLHVTNASIICHQRVSGVLQWCFTNVYVMLRDYRVPVVDNDAYWDCAVGAQIGGDATRRLDLRLCVRSFLADPVFALQATARRFTIADDWLAHDRYAQGTPAHAEQRAPTWFERCFSNEWYGFQQALAREGAWLAAREGDPALYDGALHLVISNHTYQPGFLSLDCWRRGARRPIPFRYIITNTPAVLAPIEPHSMSWHDQIN